MPLPGPEPNATRRRRNKDQHQWIEVEDTPFDGAPKLPKKRGRWSAWTLRWWHAVSTMPHCVLWAESDWQFAFDTALIHAAFVGGKTGAASELRHRERIMGMSRDARMRLRIRYVEPAEEEESLSVVAIEDYKRSLQGESD